MKKKKLTGDYIIEGWLTKYFGITMQQLVEQEPELIKTSAWYKKYAVTQEQHDEWYKWAIDEIAKYHRISKKRARHDFAFDYLNLSPSVK